MIFPLNFFLFFLSFILFGWFFSFVLFLLPLLDIRKIENFLNETNNFRISDLASLLRVMFGSNGKNALLEWRTGQK